MSVAEDVFY